MSSVNGAAVTDPVGAVRELLRQRGVALGLIGTDAAGNALEEGIEAVLDREVSTPEPTADECRRFYAQHQAEFMAGELVFARHILFGVTPGVPIGPLRSKAEQTLAELSQQPRRFAERARELSNCPSGKHGGNLGQLSRGECAPEFEKAIFGSTVTGVLPRLVTTRYGFHIVAIDKRVAGCLVPFETVHQKIAVRLAAQVDRKALKQYVAVLAGKADVRGVELNAAATPLVR